MTPLKASANLCQPAKPGQGDAPSHFRCLSPHRQAYRLLGLAGVVEALPATLAVSLTCACRYLFFARGDRRLPRFHAETIGQFWKSENAVRRPEVTCECSALGV